MADIITRAGDNQDIPVRWHDNGDSTWSLQSYAAGGGGAVTIADGADVAQGTTSDASSASTLVGLLKNLKAALAGTLNVSLVGNTGAVANTTYTTVQVSPTGTAGTLIAADAARKVLILRALSANTQSVWLGRATVTTTTGVELKPGETITFTGADVPVNLWQAISTSGTQTVIVTTGV